MPDPNDQFDFDDLKLPDKMPLEPLPDVESLGETAPADAAPSAEAPAAETDLPAEAPAASAPAEDDKKGKKKAKKKEKAEKKAKEKANKKEKIKKAKGPPKDSSRDEESDVEDQEKKPGSLQRLLQTSPYTLMLFGAVVFLLIAVIILLGELWRYKLDVNAKEAKERVSLHFSLDQVENNRLQG